MDSPPLRRRIWPAIWAGVAAASGIAAIIAAWPAVERAFYEGRGYDCWDCHLYWAVGQGMVNGLLPYRDLFEMKPPGVFLLSALSLMLTDGRTLGHLATGAAAAAMTVAPPVWTWLRRKDLPRIDRTLVTALALLTGSLLTLFTAEREGWGFQSEGFGAAAGVLCVLAFASGRPGPRSWIAAGALLWLSTVCKEPFLLPLLGAWLLLSPSPHGWRRSIPWVLGTAGGLWVGALLLTGTLDAYIGVYLHEELTNRVHTDGPAWMLGLRPDKLLGLWKDIAAFSPAFLWSTVAMAVIAPWMAWQHTSLRTLPWTLLTPLLAIALTVTGVYLGGSTIYNHHFVVAVPLGAAFLCKLATALPSRPRSIHRIALLIVIMLLGAAAACYRQPDLDARAQSNTAETRHGREMAAHIDALLTRCRWDRYLFLGPNGPHPFGYTKHSPLGPAFMQYGYFFDGSRQKLHADFRRQLQEAVVIVRSTDSELPAEDAAYVEREFSGEAPPCAQPVPVVEGYSVLFRR